MSIGAFSVSLNVKDLQKSKNFYETLGFQVFAGDESQNWLIMRSENSTIGLFQGMFEQNIMTFNPGWDQNCNKLDNFKDVREIQSDLMNQGIEFSKTVEEGSSGPGSFVISDPDGNTILFDQHV